MSKTNKGRQGPHTKASGLKVCSAALAILAALSAQTRAEALKPDRSVVDDHGDLVVSVDFPKPTTGDLYIAAEVGGVIYFFTEHGWSPTPSPREFSQTYTGTKQINLGNSGGVAPGIYPLYQVVVSPNAPNVYDARDWVGGLSSLGHTSFQVNLPMQVSDDFNRDGWADDDSNHDGFHDDDLNRDGFHDDDSNHDGFHDDDVNHDGFHDDNSNHDTSPDDGPHHSSSGQS